MTLENRVARLEAENKAIISTLSHTERRYVKEWVDAELAKNQPATPVKDWEIQVFKSTKTNNFYDLQSDGLYKHRNGVGKWSLNDMLYVESCVKSGAWAIHSVKRLSDGLIVTVGDKNDGGDVVTGFAIDDKSMYVRFVGGYYELKLYKPFNLIENTKTPGNGLDLNSSEPQAKETAPRPWESPLSQDELDECARIISAMWDSELATATLREIKRYAGTAKEDFENRLHVAELSEVANLVINSVIRLGAHKLLTRKYRELEEVTAILARSVKWHYAAILPPKRDLVVIMMNETGGQPLLGFHDHDKGWFISAGVEGQYPPSPKPPFAWCGTPDFAGYHEIKK